MSDVFRTIRHGSNVFQVVDTLGTSSWHFWEFFESGQWETTTVREADRLLHSGDLMFDIGAWVGPLTLLEASRGVHVVAVEPDPDAFHALNYNVDASGLGRLVTSERLAITDVNGRVDLGRQNGGDSQSSVTRNDLEEIVSVRCHTLEWLFNKHPTPNLVKMDIEGGESLVLPQYGWKLRELRIPLLLALHPNWYAPDSLDKLTEELSHWRMTDLYNNMYLCES